MKELSEEKYYHLHKKKLTPLSLKIDSKSFIDDIKKYEDKFQMWGDKFPELKRFGIPLVNLNGRIDNENDPSCWPLDRWNFLKKGYNDTPESFNNFYNDIKLNGLDNFLTDVDFTEKTEILDLPSLEVLTPIKKFMVRSCILKWYSGSLLHPHFDMWHPVKWLRIWGTTNPEKMKISYKSTHGEPVFNGVKKEYEFYEDEINIEAGRLYLHDSVQWHRAISFDEPVYQFFIALSLDSYDWLNENICGIR